MNVDSLSPARDRVSPVDVRYGVTTFVSPKKESHWPAIHRLHIFPTGPKERFRICVSQISVISKILPK